MSVCCQTYVSMLSERVRSVF